jgi:hypothetical protein
MVVSLVNHLIKPPKKSVYFLEGQYSPPELTLHSKFRFPYLLQIDIRDFLIIIKVMCTYNTWKSLEKKKN